MVQDVKRHTLCIGLAPAAENGPNSAAWRHVFWLPVSVRLAETKGADAVTEPRFGARQVGAWRRLLRQAASAVALDVINAGRYHRLE